MKHEPKKKSLETTDFGFERVPFAEKASKVAQVFHSVAGKYDLMNDAMSLGVHRLWKRYATECASVRPGQYVLDLAAGTGDITMRLAAQVGDEGLVVMSDINDSMLKQGRDRLTDRGVVGNVLYLQADAESLPFPNNTFDLVTIAFGLRNVTRKEKALAAMEQILKPGGKLLVLEFSKPILPLLSKIYDIYSFNVLPRLGKIIAGDSDSYRYLAESIRQHPDQETLKSMMSSAGFEDCKYENLSGGIVALHTGYKY
ncbi:MAG: ubiquinone/menaquinone biosynthesis methyltransferase [Gammaproteobacteria bacterium]|jgi:demethylmenaquinone methyltransferase/2-methoxy-6-polyprenyl-1,4-benzoquinol methylase|nr:ubiquinone/menaquinone biosynthesis methyltransferase [Gammaproteobacteria bacterium]